MKYLKKEEEEKNEQTLIWFEFSPQFSLKILVMCRTLVVKEEPVAEVGTAVTFLENKIHHHKATKLLIVNYIVQTSSIKLEE